VAGAPAARRAQSPDERPAGVRARHLVGQQVFDRDHSSPPTQPSGQVRQPGEEAELTVHEHDHGGPEARE
jgi:hypothetical protein